MIKWKNNLLRSQKVYRSADMKSKLSKISESGPSTSAKALSLYESDSSETVFYTMKDVKAFLRYLFKTDNLATFCIGNCENGTETVLSNLINCNDTVLVAVIGECGKQAANYIRRIGAKVHILGTHAGKALETEDIDNHLKAVCAKVFFLVHGECSTGVLQPINKIGELCHKYDCMFIVDVSNTIGTVDVATDKYKIDVAFAISQKAFDGVNDLLPITMSAIGLTKLEKSRVHFRSHLQDLRHLTEIWLSNDETEYIYSKFIDAPSLLSLRDRLLTIQNEQLSNVIHRHTINSKRLQHNIENSIGLEMFVTREEHRLPSMIAVCIPSRVSEHFFGKISTKRFPLEVLPGVGETMGSIIRIKLPTERATKKIVKDFVHIFYHTLQTLIPDYVHPDLHTNIYY